MGSRLMNEWPFDLVLKREKGYRRFALSSRIRSRRAQTRTTWRAAKTFIILRRAQSDRRKCKWGATGRVRKMRTPACERLRGDGLVEGGIADFWHLSLGFQCARTKVGVLSMAKALWIGKGRVLDVWRCDKDERLLDRFGQIQPQKRVLVDCGLLPNSSRSRKPKPRNTQGSLGS